MVRAQVLAYKASAKILLSPQKCPLSSKKAKIIIWSDGSVVKRSLCKVAGSILGVGKIEKILIRVN